jgi:ribosomal-protein-serine acetyltransferase
MTAPLLLDIPDFIETERLLLRAPRPGDGAMRHQALLESQVELAPWMYWAVGDLDPNESESFVRQGAAEWLTREKLPLQIIRKSDGAYAGELRLHHIQWDIPSLELGYWLHSKMHGQGYITEAVLAATKFAFEQLSAERVEIRCDARNEASAKVARRCGFIQEGLLRNHERGVYGEITDTLIFGIIRSEYLQQPK